jgi:hypothetical protein
MFPEMSESAAKLPVDGMLEVRSFTYDDRRDILASLAEAMSSCGCWLLERKALSTTQMEYRFEVQLRSAVDMYISIIECGLELTRASHVELTSLCMLRKHNGASELQRVITVRLEISFLEDVQVPALMPGVAFA